MRWKAGSLSESAGGPDVAVTLLRDLFFDGHLQRLFDHDAVEVVQVRLILRRADEGLELLVLDLQRRVAVEEQASSSRSSM